MLAAAESGNSGPRPGVPSLDSGNLSPAQKSEKLDADDEPDGPAITIEHQAVVPLEIHETKPERLAEFDVEMAWDRAEALLDQFEEDLDDDLEVFEEEMEALEEVVEERLDRWGAETLEERFEGDLEVLEDELDHMEDRIDDLLENLDEGYLRAMDREESWNRVAMDKLENELQRELSDLRESYRKDLSGLRQELARLQRKYP